MSSVEGRAGREAAGRWAARAQRNICLLSPRLSLPACFPRHARGCAAEPEPEQTAATIAKGDDYDALAEEIKAHAATKKLLKEESAALAAERAKHGDDVNMLLPMVQTWRPAILAMLNALPEPEEIISSTGPSHQQEEEE